MEESVDALGLVGAEPREKVQVVGRGLGNVLEGAKGGQHGDDVRLVDRFDGGEALAELCKIVLRLDPVQHLRRLVLVPAPANAHVARGQAPGVCAYMCVYVGVCTRVCVSGCVHARALSGCMALPHSTAVALRPRQRVANGLR